jgi:uncharacterized protein (TIGR00369 family)
MTERSPATTTHTVNRLDITIAAPFTQVVSAYEKLVPPMEHSDYADLADWDAVIEAVKVHAPLGFMTYFKLDVTAAMTGSRYSGQCVEYLMGNQVIAEQMCRHDPSTMLHAPLRTVIFADDAGVTHIVVDQPSSNLSSYANPAVADVGAYLDELVAELLTALGAPLPASLRPVPAEAMIDPFSLDSTQHGLFMRSTGLTFDSIAGDRVTAHLDVDVDQQTPWGVVHGGVYTSVVESAASVGASKAVQGRGMYAVGLNNSTDFLRPVTSARLDVLGVPLQQGRTQQLWLVTITRDDGKGVARGQLRLQNVPLPTEET